MSAELAAWPSHVSGVDDLLRRAVNQHSDQCPCDDDCYIALVLDYAARGENVTSRYWYVVSDTNDAISFSIAHNEPDSKARAEYWVRPGYHLELREDIYWRTDPVVVSRKAEVVDRGASNAE